MQAAFPAPAAFYHQKPETLNESDLIRCCQQADRKAQEIIYLRFADRMFRLASRYLKNQSDAEDALVTAFDNVFKSIKNFNYQGEGCLEAWIRRIVTNQALMILRSRHNFNLHESLDEVLPEPDIASLTDLEATDILAMIAALPTGYRTIFNLHVVEGYSHEEIGKLLSITESTSRSQLFKAKSLLKKMLKEEGYHYGT
jgi:RNA polymerase sigma factor (sigma-70 family)